jgi:short-subunit dehydrogenase
VDKRGDRRERVLITGASSGIGKELAKAFTAKGFHPILLARNREKLDQLALEIGRSPGTDVTVLVADLNDPGTPRAIFDSLLERGIQIDILVNNAGVAFEGDFAETGLEDQLRLLQINVVALTALTRLFLEPMLKRAHGRILNVSSVSAFAPIPKMAMYAASKAYVLSLSEALSEELKGTGVTITALCPGFTETPMVRQSPRASQLPSFMVMDAAAVAEQGVTACLAGETVHVPGLSNSAFAQGVQYLPRALTRALGGYLSRLAG